MVTEVIKSGYKKTNIGVIPDDWDLISFGDAFDFLSTASYSRSQLSEDQNILYVHYGDIHTKWKHFLDVSKESLPSIDNAKLKSYSFIKKGDLIMADASEDYEGICKSVEVRNIGSKEAISGLHTFLLRSKKDVFVDGFKGYISSNKLVKTQFDRLATGLKVYGVSKANLKVVLIPHPREKEQKAIFQALSDTENLIETLNKLIKKKKSIKKGAMQKLLTGKKRLPGFNGEWEERTLGDINSKKMATINPRHFLEETFEYYSIPSYQDGKQPIQEQGKNIFSSKILLENKAVLFGKLNPRVEKVWLVESNSKKRKIGSGEWITIIPDNINVVSEYIYYLVWSESVMLIAKGLVAGSTPSRQRVIPSGFYNIRVSIPKDPKQQKAIVQVLSDMDVNIENLEQERDKYKLLKEGLMQQLLTGKIRLK